MEVAKVFGWQMEEDNPNVGLKVRLISKFNARNGKLNPPSVLDDSKIV